MIFLKTPPWPLLLLLIPSALFGQCPDISGVWKVTESTYFQIFAEGDVISRRILGGIGVVTVTQNGCDISYSITIEGRVVARTGTLDGESVSLAGPTGFYEDKLSCPQDNLTATGSIINAGRIELQSALIVKCDNTNPPLEGYGTGTIILERIQADPPTIVEHPADALVSAGQSAILSCQVSGDPQPTVKWQARSSENEDWEDLVEGALYTGTLTMNLTIQSPDSALSGMQFRCVASNTGGSSFSDPATLTVEAFTNALLANASESGEWFHYDWFGWFLDKGLGWILHVEHGHLYCLVEDLEGFFVYDLGLDCWWFMSRGLFPNFFKFGANSGWYYYFPGGKAGERWFFRYSDGSYIQESGLGNPLY